MGHKDADLQGGAGMSGLEQLSHVRMSLSE
jgi:hypothetical protein